MFCAPIHLQQLQRLHLFTLVLGGLLFITDRFAKATDQVPSIFGLRFIVVCTPTQHDWVYCLRIHMTTMENDPLKVTMETRGYPFSEKKEFTLEKEKTTQESLPLKYRNWDFGTKGALLFTGDKPFSCACLNIGNFRSGDSYMSLPVEAWGTKYVMLSHSYGPAFVILTASSHTNIHLKMKNNKGRSTEHSKPIRKYSIMIGTKTLEAGTTFSVTVSQYRAFQFHFCIHGDDSYPDDISGSVAEANNPIGILSSCCYCGSVPAEFCEPGPVLGYGGSRDAVIEMLMPDLTYGKDFIVFGPPKRRTSDGVKIGASVANTQVSVLYPNDTKERSLSDIGDWYYYSVKSSPHRIIADKPVTVLFVMSSSCVPSTEQEYGDPSLSVIVPTLLFFREYVWSTFKDSLEEDFLNYVIFLWSTGMTIILDGTEHSTSKKIPVNAMFFWWQTSKTLFLGEHKAVEQNNLKFGCYLYSARDQISTLHPAAFYAAHINVPCTKVTNVTMVADDLIDNDCDGDIDEETIDNLDNDGDGKVDEDLFLSPRVDGVWSAWTHWACVPECGDAGNETRSRRCNNPPPIAGGDDCDGDPEERRECKPEFKICAKDCPDGSYGHDCKNKCPKNCLGPCQKASGFCAACKEGKALGASRNCSGACPPYCNKCNQNGSKCITCKTGLQLTQRRGCLHPSRACPPNCLGGCSQKTLECFDCKPGFQMGDDHMCRYSTICPYNCKKCQENTFQCAKCKPGFQLSIDHTCKQSGGWLTDQGSKDTDENSFTIFHLLGLIALVAFCINVMLCAILGSRNFPFPRN